MRRLRRCADAGEPPCLPWMDMGGHGEWRIHWCRHLVPRLGRPPDGLRAGGRVRHGLLPGGRVAAQRVAQGLELLRGEVASADAGGHGHGDGERSEGDGERQHHDLGGDAHLL